MKILRLRGSDFSKVIYKLPPEESEKQASVSLSVPPRLGQDCLCKPKIIKQPEQPAFPSRQLKLLFL